MFTGENFESAVIAQSIENTASKVQVLKEKTLLEILREQYQNKINYFDSKGMEIPFADKELGYKLLAKKITLKSWISTSFVDFKVGIYLYANLEYPDGYLQLEGVCKAKGFQNVTESMQMPLKDAIRLNLVAKR